MDFPVDEPTPPTRLESLPDDVLKWIIFEVFRSGNFLALRALCLSSKRFAELSWRVGVGGHLGGDELTVLGHIGNEFDKQGVPKVMRRVHRFRKKPWAYLAAWNQSAHMSANFRRHLFHALTAKAATRGSAVLSTLVPSILIWIKSCKPQDQKTLLTDLRKKIQADSRPRDERRPWQILERRIVRAGEGWMPDPEKQKRIRETLERLKAGPLGEAADPATATSLCMLVMDGLPELPANEVDGAWWALRNNVIVLHADVQAEPLFALALCIPCLSEPMRIKAFKEVAARAERLVPDDEVVVAEGLVECLDCIPVTAYQPWRESLRQRASKDAMFLPVYGASLKTLEHNEREGEFTKVFEFVLPEDPNARAACLEHLSQWVEFLNSNARSAMLVRLVQDVLEAQTKLSPQGKRPPKGKRWESIATHLVCQAHALSADEVAAIVPVYTRLILGSRCSRSTVLAALLSAICVPSNQQVLGAVFEHVLNTALPLFPWAQNEGSPDSVAMAGVLEWTECQCAVASFLRYLPASAFDAFSSVLVGRLEHVLQRLAQSLDVDEIVEGSFAEHMAMMLPVQQALMDLLHCVSPMAEPSEALGIYMTKLLQLGSLANKFANFLPELVVAFAERTHLLPPEDRLSQITLLIPHAIAQDVRLLPTIFASGRLFANEASTAALCERLVETLTQRHRAGAATVGALIDAATVSALRATLRRLLETLPEKVALPIREKYERLKGAEPSDESDTDSGEEASDSDETSS